MLPFPGSCASGATTADRQPNSVTTIERRLSSLSWNYAQRGNKKLDRKDRAIATVMVGIRNNHAAAALPGIRKPLTTASGL